MNKEDIIQRPVVAAPAAQVVRNDMHRFEYALKNLKFFDRNNALERNKKMPQGAREMALYDIERRFLKNQVDSAIRFANLDRGDREGRVMEIYFRVNQIFPGRGGNVVVNKDAVESIELQLQEMSMIVQNNVKFNKSKKK